MNQEHPTPWSKYASTRPGCVNIIDANGEFIELVAEGIADRIINAVNGEEAHRRLLYAASERLHHWDRCTYKSVEDAITSSKKALNAK